jgi:riboflavin kinase/FMN adenylyltransferase
MKILRSAKELGSTSGNVCLAIGFFDGVHLGHQQIIGRTLERARQHDAIAVVVTFDEHPATVVAPERVPALVYPLAQKMEVIARCGADALLLLRFDRPFSEQTGETFVRKLVADIPNLRSISVGENFHFGRQRSGNAELLKSLGVSLGFAVDAVPMFTLEGRSISSTKIREAIRAGDFAATNAMLGRPYSLVGAVLHGDGLGQQIGYPTANLDVKGLVLPPYGVYSATATLPSGQLPTVLNIGVRPTLRQPEPRLQVEAHIPGFDGNLYDSRLELVLHRKLRDERKFDSIDSLREQIARDIQRLLQDPHP